MLDRDRIDDPKLREELDRGRLWRVKEILRGRAAADCDPETCRLLGEVLLELGDQMEAGKYLLLSGFPGEAYDEAICVYLWRSRRLNAPLFMRTLPVAARWRELAQYPERLRAELVKRGYSGPSEPEVSAGGGDRWATIGCALVGVVFVFCAIVGFLELVGLR